MGSLARKEAVTQPELLACPTCNTPVSKANLGLRDYSRWLTPILPGKLGGSDLDCVVQQASTNRMLVIEFKEANKRITTGQRLLFKALKQRNVDVWVVWEYDGYVMAGEMDSTGEVRFLQKLTAAQLGSKVKDWWYSGLES